MGALLKSWFNRPEPVVGRCAFVVHPQYPEELHRLPLIWLAKIFGASRKTQKELAGNFLPIVFVGTIDVPSAQPGIMAKCAIWGLTMTADELKEEKLKALFWLEVIGRMAAKFNGATILGLGAHTAIVGNGGLDLATRLKDTIGVTTGNSLTVGMTWMMVEHVRERLNLRLERESAAVVGAAGSIGNPCALLLAPHVAKLYLVGKATEAHQKILHQLADKIRAMNPKLEVVVTLTENDDWCRDSRLVITATSDANAPVDGRRLASGCIVLDAARPQDIDPATAQRADLTVLDSGLIQLPRRTVQRANISLPWHTSYGCLAETLLLAMMGHQGNYTLGAEIPLSQVETMLVEAKRHGLGLAPLTSFGKPVRDKRLK